MSIDAIVLDIGNVICEWNPDRLIASAFDESNVHQQALDDTVRHSDWLLLDRGTLSIDKAISNAQKRSSLDPEKIAQVYHNLPASLTPLPDTVAAMKEVQAAGMPLHILSNMASHSWEYMERELGFWHLVDKVILSCDCHLIKPEPQIYAHLISECELNAGTSVFVDDMAENIDAAIACGLQGVQLTDPAKGGEVIRDLLGKA